MQPNTYTIGQPISLQKVLAILSKRKGVIAVVFLITLATVAVSTFLQSPVYQASLKILVEPEHQSASRALFRVSSPVKFDNQTWLNSELDILTSRPVAKRTVEDFILPYDITHGADRETPSAGERLENAVEKFQKSFTLETAQSSNVIQLNYENTDPKLAASVVNGVIKNWRD